MSGWQWRLLQFSRQLWVHATLIGILGVLAAIAAAFAERYIPWDLPGNFGADSVESVLTIIASSMLAVTTFSLSIVTSAYGAAANNVTPRATRLVMEDRITNNVLATFIGSFLFAIVGIVVLKTGAYGERGRFILFVVTIAVIALIVVSLLRWINHLTRLGRSGETTDRVESATRAAIEARIEAPFLGANPSSELPMNAKSLVAREVGYVQNIDVGLLDRIAEQHDLRIHILVMPGKFLYPAIEVARIEGIFDEDTGEDIQDAILSAFAVGGERSFEQDPRFGLAVLSEIASRALPPSANDPGTVLDILGRSTRLLSLFAQASVDQQAEVRFERVYVPGIDLDDMFEDAFMLIARDGASMIEVQLRLQKCLHALARSGSGEFRAAALRQAKIAEGRALEALPSAYDRQRLEEIRQGA